MSDGPLIVFDIEANGLLLDATKIWCVCTRNAETGELRDFKPHEMKEAYQYLLTARRLIGHNCRMYDIPVLQRIVGAPNAWPCLPASIDTQLCSRLLYPDRLSNPIKGHALADWGLYLKYPKIDFGDWSCFSDEMLIYCQGDVTLGHKIYEYLVKRLTPYRRAVLLEHDVASIIAKQVENGVVLNQYNVERLLMQLEVEKAEINDKLNLVFPPVYQEMKTPAFYRVVECDFPHDIQFSTKKDAAAWAKTHVKGLWNIEAGPPKKKEIPFNPASSKQVAERLIEYGWKPTVKTETGAWCVDAKVMDTIDIPQADGLKRFGLLADRQSQAQAWLEHVKVDGRIHGSVITNGCVTGRMSHSSPNMNIPKLGKPFGVECRSCFGPRKGWVQVGCDASGLELRMLAHYMHEWDRGAYAKIILTGDVHTENQKAAQLETRDQAKTFIYAFLYGAGDAKIGTISGGGSAGGKRLKERFKAGFPALSMLLGRLKRDVERGYITGLDGRRVPIRSEHAALNTLLQSAGAVLMKQALVLFFAAAEKKHGAHGRSWALMLNVHDEFQLECDPSIAESVCALAVDSIKQAGIALGLKIPMDGEAKIGNNWAETH